MSRPRVRARRSERAPGSGSLVGRMGNWVGRLWDAVRINVPYAAVFFFTVLIWPFLPRRPYFSSEDFPGVEALEHHYSAIAEETVELLANLDTVPAFQQVDPGQRRLSDDRNWLTLMMRFYGTEIEGNRDRFPRTAAAIDEVPGLTTAFFSVLEPGKHITWHNGPLKGVVRCHLGLAVPEGDCWIQVGRQRRKWQEGKLLLFDDTYPHRAQNNTAAPRVVLFCDLIRPMPWPWLDQVNLRLLGWLRGSRRIAAPVARAEAFERARRSSCRTPREDS